MYKLFTCRWYLKLALSLILIVPELAHAQYFSAAKGDLMLGFRKTGSVQGSYELVVNAGNITNLLAQAPGTVLPINNYSASQLTDAFPNYNNLQWSVSATFDNGFGASWNGFAYYTIWYTLPRSTASVQTTPPARVSGSGAQSHPRQGILSIGNNAATLSSQILVTTNADNNTLLVREPVGNANDYSIQIEESSGNPVPGDFNGYLAAGNAENTTPASFTSAVVSDLYQGVPTGSTDPYTGTTSGNAYYVGYFTLNPNGTMTFTRASTSVAAPVASFSGSPTNGVAPLSVTFTDASTGSGITNWIWNLGDGTSVTNTSSASVNHGYAAGTCTVSLTVNSPGGSSLATSNNYIVVTGAPPVAGFTGSPTNIFATQSVTFTNTSTGSITNWVWNFGNGSVTNTSNTSVTNTYAAAGTYNVTLTVTGSGGSNTNTQTGYIVVYPKPAIGTTKLSGGSLILSGTNGVPGGQYRILTSTSVTNPLANWTPVWTNAYGANGGFSYTNSTPTNIASFFIMVSP